MLLYKQIFRKKTTALMILVFTVINLLFLYLFKYMYVSKDYINTNINNQLKNRDIIFDNSKELNFNNEHILIKYYDYGDYLFLNNKDLGTLHVTPTLPDYFPKLEQGEYPHDSNEIIIPQNIMIDNEIINISNYLNQNIKFYVNEKEEKEFKVVGIYNNSNNMDTEIYYNVKYIDNLTQNIIEDKNTYRIIVDEYENVEDTLQYLNKIGTAKLYDESGLVEINLYSSIIKDIRICIIIFIVFIISMIIIIVIYDFNNNKKLYYLNYILGSNYFELFKKILKEYLLIEIISLVLAIIIYGISVILYSRLNLNKVILNGIFNFNNFSLCLINTLFLFLIIFSIFILFLIVFMFCNYKKKIKL